MFVNACTTSVAEYSTAGDTKYQTLKMLDCRL
jgi:hypothetical protein